MDVDFHSPGAADDAGAGVLLRGSGALQERAQHDDDELHLARVRRRAVGADRLFAGVHRPATTGSATCRTRCWPASVSRRRARSPHALFMAYQGTFCIITAALISGAIVERMRFPAYIVFISLWALLVYAPIAHWVWGGGWLAKMGALDFAGGTVVHVNAGVAALVAAIVRRQAQGLSVVVPDAAQRAVRAPRRRPPLVRLVRLQRRQRPGRQPDRRPGVCDHDARAGRDAGRLDAPRLHSAGQADGGRRAPRPSSSASSPSRRRPGSSAR